jgi:hypothetical protein
VKKSHIVHRTGSIQEEDEKEQKEEEHDEDRKEQALADAVVSAEHMDTLE